MDFANELCLGGLFSWVLDLGGPGSLAAPENLYATDTSMEGQDTDAHVTASSNTTILLSTTSIPENTTVFLSTTSIPADTTVLNSNKAGSNVTTEAPTATQTTASVGPTPTGIVSGCQAFYTVQSGDTCLIIETEFNITSSKFYQWNPSVGSTCKSLWLGYAYCMEGPPSTTTVAIPSSPTQTGITSNCDQDYTVVSGDSCASIESEFDISFAQLYEWNPAIGSDCERLWVGYAVCVAVSS